MKKIGLIFTVLFCMAFLSNHSFAQTETLAPGGVGDQGLKEIAKTVKEAAERYGEKVGRERTEKSIREAQNEPRFKEARENYLNEQRERRANVDRQEKQSFHPARKNDY